MKRALPPKLAERRSHALTPLAVIAAFVVLSEIVTSVEATRTAGGIQIAFTSFATAFPLLVAAAFFAILRELPFVLCPPLLLSDSERVGPS